MAGVYSSITDVLDIIKNRHYGMAGVSSSITAVLDIMRWAAGWRLSLVSVAHQIWWIIEKSEKNVQVNIYMAVLKGSGLRTCVVTDETLIYHHWSLRAYSRHVECYLWNKQLPSFSQWVRHIDNCLHISFSLMFTEPVTLDIGRVIYLYPAVAVL